MVRWPVVAWSFLLALAACTSQERPLFGDRAAAARFTWLHVRDLPAPLVPPVREAVRINLGLEGEAARESRLDEVGVSAASVHLGTARWVVHVEGPNDGEVLLLDEAGAVVAEEPWARGQADVELEDVDGSGEDVLALLVPNGSIVQPGRTLELVASVDGQPVVVLEEVLTRDELAPSELVPGVPVGPDEVPLARTAWLGSDASGAPAVVTRSVRGPADERRFPLSELREVRPLGVWPDQRDPEEDDDIVIPPVD
jgi:hypothetical protein